MMGGEDRSRRGARSFATHRQGGPWTQGRIADTHSAIHAFIGSWTEHSAHPLLGRAAPIHLRDGLGHGLVLGAHACKFALQTPQVCPRGGELQRGMF